ncbi:hypothetical protein A8924_6479 [Saccharopolyspora erythraea NRRL 2338]|uniref:Uncharacterized protein n=2 Tax=Saccharopolyspora erythraea TaxID=1836 RepID=A4FMN0_SACEN|nr:flavin-nucleotide-binding protein [Saccharopolyspora erythraea D]PFG98953.1 hypothetical protein A8924_6479 [Saccharopolyspora erythraea NRRL 2338]QRK88933.1 pyridoxamine 5'-phosphate oxidase family protein [Saccharopolyspora erythraea]CAM05305.1 hypothetical protein SACE_6132 [Saccharopolyspora erythraea NRRL 2338]
MLDAGLVCHLGVVVDGAPRVLPTGYGRIGDTLYLHGSTGARSLREAGGDAEVCVAVTHVDGVVYSRSAFHFSVNYRSAVVHGRARLVTDPDERLAGLRALTEHLAPGSWEHVRRPDTKELAKTAVLALSLGEASVKVRSGGANDDAEDIAANAAWAGVLPLRAQWGEPEPNHDLPEDFAVPAHVPNRRPPAPGGTTP